jgi:hypothetical protein
VARGRQTARAYARSPVSLINGLLASEGIEVQQVNSWNEVKEPVFKRIPVFVPVRENKWEGEHGEENPGRNVIVPAREIAEMFGLSILLPDCSMQDRNGVVASAFSRHGDLWVEGHSLCYLRKDIVDGFLKRKRMNLVWAFWGEREMQLESHEYHDPKIKYEHYRKSFRRIYWYSDGKINAGRAAERYD